MNYQTTAGSAENRAAGFVRIILGAMVANFVGDCFAEKKLAGFKSHVVFQASSSLLVPESLAEVFFSRVRKEVEHLRSHRAESLVKVS